MQAAPTGKQTSGKGRAQVIKDDKIKCFRPGGNHVPNGNDLPGGNSISGGDYRPGESGIFVEHSLSVSNWSKETYGYLEFYP